MRSGGADSDASWIRKKFNLPDHSPKYDHPRSVSARLRQLSSFPEKLARPTGNEGRDDETTHFFTFTFTSTSSCASPGLHLSWFRANLAPMRNTSKDGRTIPLPLPFPLPAFCLTKDQGREDQGHHDSLPRPQPCACDLANEAIPQAQRSCKWSDPASPPRAIPHLLLLCLRLRLHAVLGRS
jgi:hypothetical protein